MIRKSFIVAHLDYKSEESRIQQSKVITGMIKNKNYPVIHTGDLNAEPGSKTISNLEHNFVDANQPDKLTYPSDKPEKKIDYILIGKKHFQKTINGSVYHVNYSDHRPISAQIKLSI